MHPGREVGLQPGRMAEGRQIFAGEIAPKIEDRGRPGAPFLAGELQQAKGGILAPQAAEASDLRRPAGNVGGIEVQAAGRRQHELGHGPDGSRLKRSAAIHIARESYALSGFCQPGSSRNRQAPKTRLTAMYPIFPPPLIAALTAPRGRRYITGMVRKGDSAPRGGIRRAAEKGISYL